MAKLVIFGDGKIADEAYYYFSEDSPHEVVAFTVDSAFLRRDSLFGRPIVPFEDIEHRYPPSEFRMFVALGYQRLNALRAERYDAAKAKGYELLSYVSSRASNFGKGSIGDNCFVLENAVIQPCASIGNNVFLWTGNVVGHHSHVGDHCYIAGHVAISGNSRIEPYCFVGVNATIGHNVTIGRESLIGAASLITKSVEPRSVHIVGDTPRYRLDSESFMKMTRL